jgi:hypothetical protein
MDIRKKDGSGKWKDERNKNEEQIKNKTGAAEVDTTSR